MSITMRDLFSGAPMVNPTLRELAAEQPEHTLFEQSGGDIVGLMPGDGSAESHPAYPSALVASARASRARVRARLEAEANGTYVDPPAPEFKEAEFHEAHKHVSSAPSNNVRSADVWPWPER